MCPRPAAQIRCVHPPPPPAAQVRNRRLNTARFLRTLQSYAATRRATPSLPPARIHQPLESAPPSHSARTPLLLPKPPTALQTISPARGTGSSPVRFRDPITALPRCENNRPVLRYRRH